MITDIELTIVACSPAPANDYNVQWRVKDSGDPFTDAGNFPAGTVDIPVEGYSDDTLFEGFVQADCGDGLFGDQVPWTTEPEVTIKVHINNIWGSGVTISNVTGIDGYSLPGGGVGPGGHAYGVHNTFTDEIIVNLTGVSITGSVRLLKNGVQIACTNVGSAGAFSLGTHSFLSTDFIEIRGIGISC